MWSPYPQLSSTARIRMLLFALRFASLIYFVSAGAARCRTKAHDHRERGVSFGPWPSSAIASVRQRPELPTDTYSLPQRVNGPKRRGQTAKAQFLASEHANP